MITLSNKGAGDLEAPSTGGADENNSSSRPPIAQIYSLYHLMHTAYYDGMGVLSECLACGAHGATPFSVRHCKGCPMLPWKAKLKRPKTVDREKP